MLNPYVLGAIAIVYLASVGGAYYKGYQRAEDAGRAQYAGQLEQSIKKAQDDALIDAQAAAEVAAKEATARTRTSMLRSQANAATQNKPSPVVCNLDTDRMRLISDSISSANNETAAASVRNAVSEANRPAR